MTFTDTSPEVIAAVADLDLSSPERRHQAAIDLVDAEQFASLPVALEFVDVLANASRDPSRVSPDILNWLVDARATVAIMAEFERKRAAAFAAQARLDAARQRVADLETVLVRQRGRLEQMQRYEQTFVENFIGAAIAEYPDDGGRQMLEFGKSRIAAREVAQVIEQHVIPALLARIDASRAELDAATAPAPAAPAARTSAAAPARHSKN